MVALAGALSVGPPTDNHPVGPVISEDQFGSILDEIDRGTAESTLILGGGPVSLDGGFYIEPTIFADVAPGSTPRPARDLRSRCSR